MAGPIIEIGPGHGELTRLLQSADPSAPIVAIERDHLLAEKLRSEPRGNLRIEEGDALALLPSLTESEPFKGADYKIVGNIPYYITGHLFRIIGDLEHKPTRCVFMVQKEVALRLCAAPPDMNRLAASVQFWANATIIAQVPLSAIETGPLELASVPTSV